ncbi:MAG: TonB-dependent receptor plug domain-containing protein, partial [Spirochaetes bacterium]|nr:TonB-dependent receptor plug domain-containing protein [Spirochaetota bacterium]
MLKSKKFISVTAVFFMLICTSFLFAQDTTAESKNSESVTVKTDEKNDNAITLNNIVVTATRTEINKRETGTSLTVVTEDEIKKSGKTNIADVLTRVPGVTVNRTSVLGGETSIYIRGADTGNILVMIDGVEVNDPSHMSRAFDFSNLMLENIERIEILRGAQSTLYGSDATGGVINIITKKGRGDSSLNIIAEGGSNMTFREALNISGSTEKTYYSFSASHLKSN